MKVLKQLTIIKLLVFSALLFTLLLAFFVSSTFIQQFNSYQQADNDTRLVKLLATLEQVAHHHAVERGLTAGFLNAPSQQGLQKVTSQRSKADASEAALQALMNEQWPSDFGIKQKTNALIAQLKHKDALRGQVDAGNAPTAFQYYSLLNRFALDAAAALQAKISNNGVSSELKAAFYFAQIKERLGQLRGKANGILAKRAISEKHQAELQTYYSDVQVLQQYLQEQLNPSALLEFERAVSSPQAKEIQRVVQILLADSPDFTQLPSSATWFPLATLHIGNIKQLLDAQWANIIASSLALKASVKRTLIIGMSLTALTLLVLLLLNQFVIRTLKKQLEQLLFNLKKIAENGDLTVDVRLESHNELGIISQSVHKTLCSLKAVIEGLERSINLGSELNSHLSKNTEAMLIAADESKKMTETIASAVDEISTTIETVAKSAESSLSQNHELKLDVENSLVVIDQNGQAVGTLSKEVQEVNTKAHDLQNQVSEISTILTTIISLSEQTNLLALNAAIEAARAGDHGRGFAVVADEVRALAQGSRDASEKIGGLLQGIRAASDEVSERVKSANQYALQAESKSDEAKAISRSLKTRVMEAEELSHSLAFAAKEQTVAVNQINEGIHQVNEASVKGNELAIALRKVFDKSLANNDALKQTMMHFKI